MPISPDSSYATGDDSLDRPLQILCIDDDPQICESISIRLSGYNVNVETAFFGTHGFWLAQQNKPDLIITDLKMPQGDGDFVVETIRANTTLSNLPIVVLSGKAKHEFQQSVKGLDIDGFLRKPIDFDELIDVLSGLIPLQLNSSVAI